MTGNRQDAESLPSYVSGETYLPYPRPRSVFVTICALLPPAGVALLYLPYLPEVTVIWFIVGLALVVLFPQLLFLFFPWTKGLTLSDEGISAGKRSVKWEEIAEISKRRMRVGPFILVAGGAKRHKLWLPPYSVVFREVLPVVLRRSPDVVISKRARRAMDNPEAATSIPRWTAAVIFSLTVGLAAIPFLARSSDVMSFLIIALAFVIPVDVVVGLACGLVHTIEQRFVREVTGSLIFLGWILTMQLFIDAPLYFLDTLVAVSAMLFLVAGIVVWTRLKLAFLQKAIILVCVVGVPAAIYVRGAARALPRQDITHLLGEGMHVPPFAWSKDGNLFVKWGAQGDDAEQQVVANLAKFQSTPLPVHNGFQMVWGLERSCVVRSVLGEKKRALYLYRFSDEREVKLSEAEKTRLAMGRCISPNGKLVCWLEWTGDPPEASLKTYDVDNGRIEPLEITFPDDKEIDWEECGWVDDKTLGVRGHSPRRNDKWYGPQALHVLRVDYDDRTVSHVVTSQRFLRWRVSPDFRHAFACGQEENSGSGVHYVNLRTGRTIELGSQSLPAWQSDSRGAFRVVAFGEEGTWLCRFDTDKLAETRLLEIPEDMELVSPSPNGRFAILTYKEPRVSTLCVVNVATGQRRRLNISVVGSFLATIASDWEDYFPSVSLWSSDERRFLLSSFVLAEGHTRMYLYTVPDDWLRK